MDKFVDTLSGLIAQRPDLVLDITARGALDRLKVVCSQRDTFLPTLNAYKADPNGKNFIVASKDEKSYFEIIYKDGKPCKGVAVPLEQATRLTVMDASDIAYGGKDANGKRLMCIGLKTILSHAGDNFYKSMHELTNDPTYETKGFFARLFS